MFCEQRGQLSGLLACPRDKDALSEQRSSLIPVQLVSEPYDLPHHNNRRRFHVSLFGLLDDIMECADHGPLVRSCSPSNQGDRRLERLAFLRQTLHDGR